jgi:hypothetical protein
MHIEKNTQAMQGPGISGQKQSWKIGIGVPELGGKDKTTKGFDTAGVDLGRI